MELLLLLIFIIMMITGLATFFTGNPAGLALFLVSLMLVVIVMMEL